VQLEARMAQQPALDGWGLVGAVIIEDQVQFQVGRDRDVKGLRKPGRVLPSAVCSYRSSPEKRSAKQGRKCRQKSWKRPGSIPSSAA
jgi:hypothetical protein